MSKFNQTSTVRTVNRSGHRAFKMSDKENLVAKVLTTFFGESKYYGNTENDLFTLAKQIDPLFLANLTAMTRKEFYLRSVFHALVALMANRSDTKKYVRKVCQFIERPDDITEILAFYIGTFGKPIPNSLKKGLGDALGKFNEYQIAKYSGGNKSVKFRDVLRICHPHPSELFKKIKEDTLETPYTWEVELSKRGNTKEVWDELLTSGKVGYMALLRNLRNIMQVEVSCMEMVAERIENKEEVLKSKQLPFRFYSAYRTLKQAGLLPARLALALNRAIEHSIENMEKFEGKTLIAIDVSGSMCGAISSRSDIKCSDIAVLFGCMAHKLCEKCEVIAFDTSLGKMNVNNNLGILENFERIPVNGGGTEISLVPQYAIGKDFDRIILFSDNEANRGIRRSQSYLAQLGGDVFVHAVDLQGYGTQQFKGKNVNVIAGWNERVFDFMHLAEKGFGGVVKAIENTPYIN